MPPAARIRFKFTYIKQVLRLFEITDPAVVVSFFMVGFFAMETQVPALMEGGSR
jgi:hypothetical protein